MQEGQAMLPGAPKIYAAIAGVINDIGVVSKDKVNKQQGFKYRSVDDVYSVLNPALANNKVLSFRRFWTRPGRSERAKAEAGLLLSSLK